MRENKKNNHFRKLVVVLLFAILISMSGAQALIKFNIPIEEEFTTSNIVKIFDDPPPQPLDDPYFTWEDDFETLENINPDPDFSYDFEMVGDTIQIKNTYSIWTNPDWTRMKPIEVTNGAGQKLYDYAVNLIVEYDPDMQSDYDDIRFKHEESPTTWLDYWIETSDTSSASVWVKIEEIPTGTSMLYLFYGNPSAISLSDFYSVFSDWEEEWSNDEKITLHMAKEGAWDPDVSYGNGEFLVAWEEGQYKLFPYTLGIKQEIRASIYEPDGTRIVFDERVFNDGTTYYRNEDPSIAYGTDRWFVSWQHYEPVANPDATTMDIKARWIKRNGDELQLGSVIDVCDASNRQADSNVQFDSINDQFCVAWEDGRNGFTNYNIYARLYDDDGSPVGNEVIICDDANCQFEPWIAFDNINEQYMIVWEEAEDWDVGPFSLKAGLFDAEDLDQIGNTIDIADATSDTDYIYPCVEFCEETECFLITYNDGDLSANPKDYSGNVWGIILDTTGDVIEETFQIRAGNFVRTDIVPYLSSSFFVSFDDDSTIWGKLVSSEGDVFVGDVQLSVSTSAVADEVNLAVGDGEIFVAWEDTRVNYSYPWDDNPDVYGNIWNLNIPTGSDVTFDVKTEKQLILNAQVTSKPIEPDEFVSWYEFYVDYEDSVTFNILDSTASTVLIGGAGNGEDLSGIDPEEHPAICLQAYFSRDNPSSSPLLDYWKVIYVGIDDDPPETTISIESGQLGENGWYVGNVKCSLSATDGQHGSGVNHTYFQIDDGDEQEYDDAVGIKIPLHATGDPNTLYGEWDIYYWSVDKSGNLEPRQGPLAIKIDKAPPYCNIWDPPDRAKIHRENGGFWVQATATDEGSGIHYVLFDIGPPYEDPVIVYDDDPPGSGEYTWFCTRYFTLQWRHIIAQAYDYAGHMYEWNIYVWFPWKVNNFVIQGTTVQNVVQMHSQSTSTSQTQGMATGVTGLTTSQTQMILQR